MKRNALNGTLSRPATPRGKNTSRRHMPSPPQPVKPSHSLRSAPHRLLVANIVLNVALVLLPHHCPLLRKISLRSLSPHLHHQSDHTDRLRGLRRTNLRRLAFSNTTTPPPTYLSRRRICAPSNPYSLLPKTSARCLHPGTRHPRGRNL